MLHDNVTDREAEERARFDLRWKVALDLPMDEAGFDFTSLCKFRTGLIVSDKNSVVFDSIIKMAIEALAMSDGGMDGRPIPEEEYMDANMSSLILARDHL